MSSMLPGPVHVHLEQVISTSVVIINHNTHVTDKKPFTTNVAIVARVDQY